MKLFLVTVFYSYSTDSLLIAATDYASAYRQYVSNFFTKINQQITYLIEFRKDHDLPFPNMLEILEAFELDFQITPIDLANGTVIKAHYDKITEELTYEVY